MGTDEPTPMRSARAKLMMTNGMARFSAANGVLAEKLADEHAVEELIERRGEHAHRARQRCEEKQLARRGCW